MQSQAAEAGTLGTAEPVAAATSELTVAHAMFAELAEDDGGVVMLLTSTEDAVDTAVALISLAG
jgi:hypothetical protein